MFEPSALSEVMFVETPKEIDEIGKRLLRAAEIIEERGWCQGLIQDGNHHVCAVGALRLAFGSDIHADNWSGLELTAYERLKAALSERVGDGSVADWNDEEFRTKEQVIGALKAAAFTRDLKAAS